MDGGSEVFHTAKLTKNIQNDQREWGCGVMVIAADGFLHKFVLCLHRNKRTRPRGFVYPEH